MSSIIPAAIRAFKKSGVVDLLKGSETIEAFGDNWQTYTMPIGYLLKKQGPGGEELYQRYMSMSQRGHALDAGAYKMEDDMFKGFKDQDYEDYFKYTDTDDPTNTTDNPKVLAAVDTWSKGLDSIFPTLARASNLGFRRRDGKIVTFMKNPGRWFPRITKPHFWRDVQSNPEFREKVANDLVQQNLENGTQLSKEDAIEQLLHSAKENGNMLYVTANLESQKLGRFQRARQAKIPGSYETNPRVALRKHYHEMSHRIAMAEYFGPKDMAGKEVRQLIESTKDPEKTDLLVRRILNREGPNLDHRYSGKVLNTVGSAMAWLHLSRFVLSNTAQLGRIPMVTGWKPMMQALDQFIYDRTGFYQQAIDSGARSQVLSRSILREGTYNPIDKSNELVAKVYGIEKSEQLNRSLASASGRAAVELAHKALKVNPGSNVHRNDLMRLLNLTKDAPQVKTFRNLETIDDVIGQEGLTPQQLNMAGFQAARYTQGIADPASMPYWMNSHPLFRLWWMFRRYAYTDTANIINAIKTNPKRAIPAYLALSQVFGELIGSTKTGIKEVVSGKEIDRGKPYSDNPIVGRMISNTLNSWMFGLLEDVYFAASRGEQGMLEFLAGAPADAAIEFVTGPIDKLKSSVPVIGSGL